MAGVNGMQMPLVILASITGDCTGAGKNYTVNRAGTVVDVRVVSNAVSGGGTVTVRNVADAITNAIAMAADTTSARAGTLDNDHYTFAAGGTMNFVTNGANDRGDVTVIFLPPVAYAVTQA